MQSFEIGLAREKTKSELRVGQVHEEDALLVMLAVKSKGDGYLERLVLIDHERVFLCSYHDNVASVGRQKGHRFGLKRLHCVLIEVLWLRQRRLGNLCKCLPPVGRHELDVGAVSRVSPTARLFVGDLVAVLVKV